MRITAFKRIRSVYILIGFSAVLSMAVAPGAMAAKYSGGAGILAVPQPTYETGGGTPSGEPPQPTTQAPAAILSKDGRTAIPPAGAPLAVKKAVWAANRITNKPYRYGGGHRRWRDRGYDCSGAVSYALHGGGIIDAPLFSGLFMRWAEPGRGEWITVYTNRGHAYVVIAGLRFDTSGPGERGPRWRSGARSSGGYVARHPEGF